MNQYKVLKLSESDAFMEKKVADFLMQHKIKYENVDQTVYVAINNEIVATASKKLNIIKCFAILQQYKKLNWAKLLVTILVNESYHQNFKEVFVFSKPENSQLFQSLGFQILFDNSEAIFLTNRYDLYERQVEWVKNVKMRSSSSNNGAVILNADPLNLNHEFLICKALEYVDFLYVILVNENLSFFSFEEQWLIAKKFADKFWNVILVPTIKYMHFSTIFTNHIFSQKPSDLKLKSEINTFMFTKIFVNNLQIKNLFFSEGNHDKFLYHSHEVMNEQLKKYNITTQALPSLKSKDGSIISTKAIHKMLKAKNYDNISNFVSKDTWDLIKNKA